MLFFARFDVSHVGYPVSTSSSSEAALNPMGDPCCVIHRVSCIPMGWDEFFLSRFCTRMHWSGLDRIAKLAKKKRGKMIEVHCYSCFYSTFWKSKIDHLDGWPVFYWLRIEKELRLLVMMERYGKIWKKCVFFLCQSDFALFSGATWCHMVPQRHVLRQNAMFKFGLLCLHQSHKLPPTCEDLRG